MWPAMPAIHSSPRASRAARLAGAGDGLHGYAPDLDAAVREREGRRERAVAVQLDIGRVGRRGRGREERPDAERGLRFDLLVVLLAVGGGGFDRNRVIGYEQELGH